MTRRDRQTYGFGVVSILVGALLHFHFHDWLGKWFILAALVAMAIHTLALFMIWRSK